MQSALGATSCQLILGSSTQFPSRNASVLPPRIVASPATVLSLAALVHQSAAPSLRSFLIVPASPLVRLSAFPTHSPQMQYVLMSPILAQMFVVLLVLIDAMLVQYWLTLVNCPVFVRAARTCLKMSTILPGRRPLYLPKLGL